MLIASAVYSAATKLKTWCSLRPARLDSLVPNASYLLHTAPLLFPDSISSLLIHTRVFSVRHAMKYANNSNSSAKKINLVKQIRLNMLSISSYPKFQVEV